MQWKVIWDKNPENDIKEYIVYKGDKEISRVKSPDTVYVDTDLEPGKLYSYRIRIYLITTIFPEEITLLPSLT